MAKKSVFDQIKKQNGENFAKAIRDYDNGIFDVPDIVDIVKYAGRDAEPIMQYLISLKNITIEEDETGKDPIELLSEAGYDAYYVTNLEEQNRISKYFFVRKKKHDNEDDNEDEPELDESLCTFRDPTRFQKYHIINAVKKNVGDIKRENFWGKEQREDEYGTSVISIQILTSGGFISIKNRYNHTVVNPDNTFNSNPDRIIRGLSCSLRKHFNVDFSSSAVPLPNGYVKVNRQILRYHREADNIYFGDAFYAKDGNIFQLNKDTELMLDTCVLNLQKKTLYDPTVCREPISIDDVHGESGSFMSVLANEFKGKTLQITKNKDGGKNKDGEYNVSANGEVILTTKNGEITALNLPNTTSIGDWFLHYNTALERLEAPKLEKVGDEFLPRNTVLESLEAPKLEKVGDEFLCCNTALKSLSLPELTTAGNYFLRRNTVLESLEAPKLEKVGAEFLYNNTALKRLEAPNLTTVRDDFLHCNTALKSLSFPELTTAGSCFLCNNTALESLEAPKLEGVGKSFLCENTALKSLNLPELTTAGDYFLYENTALESLEAPKLEKVGDRFLYENTALKSLEAPNLTAVGSGFLYNNRALESLEAPKLEGVGRDFLYNNTVLERGDASKAKEDIPFETQVDEVIPQVDEVIPQVDEVIPPVEEPPSNDPSELKSFLSKNQEDINSSNDGKSNASKKNILLRLFQGGKGEHSGLKSFLPKNQEGINSSNDGKLNASKKNILLRLFQGGKG